MLEDLELGLQLCLKITNEHIYLTPFSVMNICLAVQVLSTSVNVVLKEYGQSETADTAKYCEMFDNFFDCMNIRNTQECISKQNLFLELYTSVEDECPKWLMGSFSPDFFNCKRCSYHSRLM